jgi:thioredoxin 1
MNTTARVRLISAMLACAALCAGGLHAADASDRASDTPALPRLVDLGSGRCIPCRLMKPILDELKRDYGTQFETVFIDVWENRDEGKRYGIRMIPTQIFYDAAGTERFRHEGFMAKKDILAKWQELGVALGPPASGSGN